MGIARKICWTVCALVFALHANGETSQGIALEQIKAALAEIAMDRGVEVVSQAYIDAEGELHESTYFRSGTQVRGLRMTSYFAEEAYAAQPAFADTALNISLACEDVAPHRFKKTLAVETLGFTIDTEPDAAFAAALAGVEGEILAPIEAELDAQDTFTRVTLGRNSQQARSGTSAYAAALAPRPSRAASAPQVAAQNVHTFLIVEASNVTPSRDTAKRLAQAGVSSMSNTGRRVAAELGFRRTKPITRYAQAPGAQSATVDFDISLSFSSEQGLVGAEALTFALRFDRESNQITLRHPPLKQLSLIPSRIGRRDEAKDGELLTSFAAADLKDALHGFVVEATKREACAVEEFTAYQAASGSAYRLNQGSLSGIDLDDEFLLSESPLSSRRQGLERDTAAVSSTQLENLAIARVTQVGPESALLVIVEGPSQSRATLSAIPF